MSKIHFQKVILIGVGLIGGSVARDLLKNRITKNLVGFDRNKQNLNFAYKNGIITKKGVNLQKELAQCDVLILAIPVVALAEKIRKIARFVSPQTLVIDVGSTKEKIVQTASQSFPEGNFVGCHPMAGSEQFGPQASMVGLFQDRPCLIVPASNSKPHFVQLAKKLWKSLGANTIQIKLEKHDRYLAACSHLPHVLSFALMRSVANWVSPNELKKMAGKSFKSYTRIAGSDAQMWADIFIANQKNIVAKIKNFKKELDRLEKMIESGDFKKMLTYMKKSSALWRKM